MEKERDSYTKREQEKEFIFFTTGAGDQFAAGFLYGMASNCDLETSCKMGNIAAGEVIGHIGPRPKVSVKNLFIQSELISGFTDAVV